MGESFEQACDRAAPFTLIGADRLRVLWDTVRSCALLSGAMVEVGVYRGGSAALIHAAAPNHTLALYDTFAGHPSNAQPDEEESHRAGRFSETSVEAVRELVGPYPFIVDGLFPKTLGRYELPPLVFVHCDVDLYESTRAVLEHLWPLLVGGGAVVCDDYGFDDCPGAKRAVEEFVLGRTDVLIERLPTLQARLWKQVA